MRLKEILFEDEKFDIPDYIRKIKSDCRTYFNVNEDMLKSGFAIWRTSKKNRDKTATKIPPREREKIQGSVIRSFYFEKFKPDNVPSRKKLTACQGGKPSDFVDGTDYVVFPIGNNYRFFYHPGVEDFNRPINLTPNFVSSLLYEIDVLSIEVENREHFYQTDSELYKNSSEEVQEALEILFQKLKDIYLHSEEARKYNFEYHNELWNFLVKNRDYYSKFFTKTYESIERARKNMKEYLSNLVETKSLRRDMHDREVSLYAPDGFYYLKTNKREYKQTKLKLLFLDKLSKEKRQDLFGF